MAQDPDSIPRLPTYEQQVRRLTAWQRRFISQLGSSGLILAASLHLPAELQHTPSTHPMPVSLGRGLPLGPNTGVRLTQVVFAFEAEDAGSGPTRVPVTVGDAEQTAYPGFPGADRAGIAVSSLEYQRAIGLLPDLASDCTYIIRPLV